AFLLEERYVWCPPIPYTLATQTAGTSPRRHSGQALQPAHRRSRRPLDQTLHPLSRQTPSARHGPPGGATVPDAPSRGRARRRLDAEPGVKRPALSVSAGPQARHWLDRGGGPCQAAATDARSAHVGRGRRRVAAAGGTPWIMATLLYGAGLRLMECVRLR